MFISKCFLINEIFAQVGIDNSFYDFNIVNVIQDNNLKINFYQLENEQKIANLIYNEILTIILSEPYYYETNIDPDNINYTSIYQSLNTKLIIRLMSALNPYLPLLTSAAYSKIIALMTPSQAIKTVEVKSFVETIGQVENNQADNNYNDKNIQTNSLETNNVDANIFKDFFAIKQRIAKIVINNLFYYDYNPDDFDYLTK